MFEYLKGFGRLTTHPLYEYLHIYRPVFLQTQHLGDKMAKYLGRPKCKRPIVRSHMTDRKETVTKNVVFQSLALNNTTEHMTALSILGHIFECGSNGDTDW